MAQNGLKPSQARPAAKVTACCSAMPTSKVRSGNSFWNRSTPVPDGIAAVIATMVSSFFASLIRLSPNTLVYCGAPPLDFACAPVATSNLTTPWYLSAEFSAGA